MIYIDCLQHKMKIVLYNTVRYAKRKSEICKSDKLIRQLLEKNFGANINNVRSSKCNVSVSTCYMHKWCKWC